MASHQTELLARMAIETEISAWVEGLHLQRTRVLASASGSWARQLDAHFFAVVLQNLLRAVGMGSQYRPEAVRRAMDRFDEAVPHVKDVRNVLEHFDEYRRGTGRLQTKGDEIPYGAFLVEIKGECVIFAGNKYVSVDDATRAGSALAEVVRAALLSPYDRSGP